MPTSTKDTREHIAKVRARIAEVCQNLQARAKVHDASKLEEPERSGFAALHADPRAKAYWTDDYRAAIQDAKETIAHHYAANTHHIEHWPNGIADMSLLDILEMFADWKAATERGDTTFTASLAASIQRFGIPRDLAMIFENTRKELGW